jgi:predicted RNA-binding protein YlqC (UPF0109 family)
MESTVDATTTTLDTSRSREVLLPAHLAGHFIGAGGHNIKTLRGRLEKATIYVQSSKEASAEKSHTTVKIQLKPNETSTTLIDAAEKEVRVEIKRLADGSEWKDLFLPDSIIGRFIGKERVNIKALQSRIEGVTVDVVAPPKEELDAQRAQAYVRLSVKRSEKSAELMQNAEKEVANEIARLRYDQPFKKMEQKSAKPKKKKRDPAMLGALKRRIKEQEEMGKG